MSASALRDEDFGASPTIIEVSAILEGRIWRTQYVRDQPEHARDTKQDGVLGFGQVFLQPKNGRRATAVSSTVDRARSRAPLETVAAPGLGILPLSSEAPAS